MLYQLLKVIIQIALKVFFKSLKVKGKQNIPPPNTPLLIVSNHPNTFMDPLLIAHFMKQELHFLAQASVFKTSFHRWILGKLNMIPIQRKEDKNTHKFDNQQIFQRCYDFLAKGKAVLIFPEGTSVHERRLQKIKTGAARIALGAEASLSYQLSLKILPVGINYSQPDSFRSNVFIKVGKCISVQDFVEDYMQDSRQTITELTACIQEKLEELTIVTHTHAHDILTKNIEKVYKNHLVEELELEGVQKEKEFSAIRYIAHAIHFFEKKDPERVDKLDFKLRHYLHNLNRVRLSDEIFSKKKQNGRLFWNTFKSFIFLMLGAPIYLYGFVNNYIPYILPSKIAVKVTVYDVYIAPIMLITGIFTFSSFYLLQTFLLYYFVQSVWFACFYLLSLPITGFFSLHYAHYLFSAADKWRLVALFYKRNSLISTFIQTRKEIIQEIEQAKQEYINFHSMNTSSEI